MFQIDSQTLKEAFGHGKICIYFLQADQELKRTKKQDQREVSNQTR